MLVYEKLNNENNVTDVPQDRITVKCEIMVEVNHAGVQRTQMSCGLRCT